MTQTNISKMLKQVTKKTKELEEKLKEGAVVYVDKSLIKKTENKNKLMVFNF